jgi:hypothetical protein
LTAASNGCRFLRNFMNFSATTPGADSYVVTQR